MTFLSSSVVLPPGLLADFQLGLFVLQLLLFLSSLFLMLLVLVQRGKGGGLTGALGGSGGNSAFGAKAGDAFTKITIVTAAVWIFLCMITIAAYNRPPVAPRTAEDNTAASGVPDEEGDGTTQANPDETTGEDAAAPATNPAEGEDNTFELPPSTTQPPAGGDAAGEAGAPAADEGAETPANPPAGEPSTPPASTGETESGSGNQ